MRRALSREVDLRKLASRKRDASVVDQALLTSLQALKPVDQKLIGLLYRAQTTLIISLAAHTAVVLFGLVLSFDAHTGTAILPFTAVALVLNILAFPDPLALAERGRRLLELRG